jgi:hypothetical protein
MTNPYGLFTCRLEYPVDPVPINVETDGPAAHAGDDANARSDATASRRFITPCCLRNGVEVDKAV